MFCVIGQGLYELYGSIGWNLMDIILNVMGYILQKDLVYVARHVRNMRKRDFIGLKWCAFWIVQDLDK